MQIRVRAEEFQRTFSNSQNWKDTCKLFCFTTKSPETLFNEQTLFNGELLSKKKDL